MPPSEDAPAATLPGMKRPARILIRTSLVVAILWTLLTLWAQFLGKEQVFEVQPRDEPSTYSALIVYNPDPFYNLDEQVCRSFAEGLAESGFSCTVATVNRIPDSASGCDLFMFCANTYNWAPDWRITSRIGELPLKDKACVGITLGSGSTARAKRKLDEAFAASGCLLMDSRELWLMRPNDEGRMEEENTQVACDLARVFGRQCAKAFLDSQP